ncbi:von Willebrand factor type A [Fibrisoma limi BUZ 3]|uniref:von Willebrand factor type A n=1 Tax=Fibrisoma limi BUZ 3 TaxID=1185876 RepID=I2GG85_9BACT|nr:vWA domain-containing protein [Fibrisoma limi]CCH52910.1 von Willebrand factor type A [Fibrisoma limi BUZ 3]
MKTYTSLRLPLLVLIGTFLMIWSCRREVEVPLPAVPKIQGKPSAASLGGTVTGQAGTDKVEFRVDLYVVDRSGRYVQGLKQGNFAITATNPSSFTYALTKLDVVGQTAKAGGYSAMMLMDQSASIAYQQVNEPPTDPNDLRIAAGKIFLDYLGKEDYAALSSFSAGYRNFILYHSNFTNNVTGMKASLDSLSTTETGGTPLYYATVEAVNYTSRNAKTNNKAVIVFTDGQNNQSGTLSNTITIAKQRSIPLFTVGLSTGVNVQVLSQMANETGGAFFYAKDAEQLVTSFGTLGNLLRGTAQLYRTTWMATRRTGRWASGNEIAETIKVTIPNGEVIDVPFYVRVP